MFYKQKRSSNRSYKLNQNSNSLVSANNKLSLERLEDRIVLSSNPVLSVAMDQTIDEGDTLNLVDIGVFSDAVVGSGGSSIGLNPDDFTAIGAFDPLASVVFDTDALTIDGVSVGAVTTSADTGGGAYDIAVFAFSSFELDAGVSITATGSRPLAILSQGNLDVAGIIDVSAVGRIAGAGGGNGGEAVTGQGITPLHGNPAAGAPSSPQPTGIGTALVQGASAGAFGGAGGDGTLLPGGQAYGNLTLGIQGGSGGGASLTAFQSGQPSTLLDGGAGGGGIELGANGAITVSGSVLADGSASNNLTNTSTTSGAGAGGGILLHAFDVTVSGTLSATGGNSTNLGGAGGGGRVLISHDTSGAYVDTGAVISVTAGTGSLAGSEGVDGEFSIVPTTSTPTLETYDYVINWGDGSPTDAGVPDIDVVGAPGTDHEGSFDGSHTYADDGVYTVSITVNDSGGGTTTETFDVTVSNVAPTLTLTGAANSDEGATYTLNLAASDPGDDTISQWDIDWGDGTSETLSGNPSTASHTYADGDNNYVISATATDEDGTFAAGNTVAVTIANLDPVILTLTTDSPAIGGLEAGDTVTLTANFTDAGLLDTHTANINWGDGTTSVGVIDQLTGTVTATHIYTGGGLFDVSLTLEDDDSGTAADSTGAVIAGVGLNNGVLQVVGTNNDDIIKVYKSWYSGNLKVISSLGGAPFEWDSFNLSSVNEIEMLLGDGDDLGFVSSRVNIDATIDGGAGNDWLFGGRANDVILGGAGNDVLFGRQGRDMLIGGEGSDYLFGDGGEDILIAGTTAHDNNATALDAIMAEWTSSNSYTTRVENLTNTGVGTDFDNRLNDDFFLVASGLDATVFDDAASDLLMGGWNRDLYFANLDGGVEDCVIGLRCYEMLAEMEEADV